MDTSGYSWADFPTVGFNKDKIVVSWNYFPQYVGYYYYGVGLYVFDKTNMYAGGSVSPQLIYRPYQSGSTINGFNITPAICYNTNDSTMYLLQDYQDNTSGSSYLAIYTITGSAGSATLTLTPNFPSAPAWWSAGPNYGDIAPQLGTSHDINTVDSRLSEVVYRNGSLWCAQTIFLPANNPTRAVVQWWQVGTNGIVLQNGRLDDPNGVTMYAFPSIAVNRFGDALIGYSKFSTNQYASADYSLHALNDPSAFLESDYVFKSGESPYWKQESNNNQLNRWGDYSMTCVDPVNDKDFWTAQEYAAQYYGSLTNGSGRWGVWWANVQLPAPTNDFFTNAIAISGSEGTTNETNVRATKEPSEPTIDGNAGGASIWYEWTAPTNGSVTIDTTGSSISTLLGIYTGTSVNNLTLVADGQSQVIFTATSGTTYRIAVDGLNGAMGNLVLNWIQPTRPVFTLQPQSWTKYEGDSVSFTANAIGTPTPTYQWQFNGVSIIGATFASYTNASITTNDAGDYTCVASNSAGSTTSAVAVLTVLSSQATLTNPIVTNGVFQLTVSKVTGLQYAVEANTNLTTTNWVILVTNTAPFTFTDSAFTNDPMRFYRAIYLP